MKVENEKVTTVRDLRNAMRERADKNSYSLTVVRNRKEMAITVKPEKPEQQENAGLADERPVGRRTHHLL